jgi:hypothetical protein
MAQTDGGNGSNQHKQQPGNLARLHTRPFNNCSTGVQQPFHGVTRNVTSALHQPIANPLGYFRFM